MCVCVCVRVRVCVRVCVCECVYACVLVCVCKCVYIRAIVHACAQSYLATVASVHRLSKRPLPIRALQLQLSGGHMIFCSVARPCNFLLGFNSGQA